MTEDAKERERQIHTESLRLKKSQIDRQTNRQIIDTDGSAERRTAKQTNTMKHKFPMMALKGLSLWPANSADNIRWEESIFTVIQSDGRNTQLNTRQHEKAVLCSN